jgi:phosphoribosylformylglycinamidine synthase subunit PurL
MRLLFGEAPGGFIVSGIATGVRALGRRTPVRVIGTVVPAELRIDLGEFSLSASLTELTEAHGALAVLFS